MSVIELRPRFRLRCDLSAGDVCKRLGHVLDDDNDGRLEGYIHEKHIVLRFPQAKRKQWSPQIDMMLEEHGTGTIIRGHIGPSPGIWTFFMFLYFFFGIAFIFLLMTGYSQWTLYGESWPLWLAVVSIGAMVMLYFAARFGQKKAHSQTEELKSIITRSLENRISVIPREEWHDMDE